jgi:hypothetical protein
MATICVLEFDSINEATGEPMWPPTQVTAAQAFGAALALQATTRYVAVTPDANCRVRVSQDGAAPTTGFPQIRSVCTSRTPRPPTRSRRSRGSLTVAS